MGCAATIMLAFATYALLEFAKAGEAATRETSFALEGSNGRYARLDTRNLHSTPLVFDSHTLGDRPRDATIFLLDSQGRLVVSSTSTTQFGGHQAMQATNAGTNAVVFEPTKFSGAGYTPLACSIDRDDLAFTCTIQGHGPSGGTISKSREWYLGAESGPQFSVKAVPVPNEQSRPHHDHDRETAPDSQQVLRKELCF